MKLKLHFYIFFYSVCGGLVAQTTFTVNNINYETLTATTVTVTGEVTQTQEHELTIPSTVTNLTTNTTYTVTQIKENAFDGNTTVTSGMLPNTVILIGEFAFADCINLTSIMLPTSLTLIDDFAFSGCINLTNVTLPASLISIGELAFANCTNLTSITTNWEMPIVILPNVFDGLTLSDITLNVPVGTIESNYKNALVWQSFAPFNDGIGSSFIVNTIIYKILNDTDVLVTEGQGTQGVLNIPNTAIHPDTDSNPN